MARRFTLAEAQRLIPRAGELLEVAIATKAAFEEAEAEIQEFQQRVTLMGGISADRDRAIESKKKREEAAARLRAALEQAQEIGCVIKDLDIGLIDFPTLYRGTEVYLCWKLGEEAIEFWHGVDEGFRGRKRIDQDFLDNHQGDREQ